jgi:hypothetical protein
MDGTQEFYAPADLGDGKTKHLSEALMKLPILSASTLTLILTAAGCCDTRQVRKATAYGVMDAAPQVSDKGYVEFYTHTPGAAVPIYAVDSKGRQHSLGAVGVHRGDPYSSARYEGMAAEKLRVAVPPGDQTFSIERNGPRIQVPVSSGQVTPVEIYYVRQERGMRMDIYTASMDVHPQIAATELPKK